MDLFFPFFHNRVGPSFCFLLLYVIVNIVIFIYCRIFCQCPLDLKLGLEKKAEKEQSKILFQFSKKLVQHINISLERESYKQELLIKRFWKGSQPGKSFNKCRWYVVLLIRQLLGSNRLSCWFHSANMQVCL